MPSPKIPWVQFLSVGLLGGLAGFAYRIHRAAEQAWSSTHYRLDENVGFPISRGIPFSNQFILGASGERIDVPLPPGRTLDWNGATWWTVNDTGRMRTWNEERVEVFPTLREVEGR